MAKKPDRKKAKTGRKTKRHVKPTLAPVVSPTGPVTLAEAKVLVRTRRPTLAKRATQKEIAPAASPAAIGLERKKFRQKRREALADHLREYTATIQILKQRGVRRPRGKRAARAAVSEGESFIPLQIIAEGDSWFEYPVPFFGGGIINRLERRIGVPILNLAKAGDEVRYMLGVEERTRLTEHLSIGCPAGGPWDALLFSGGGNDIVDNPMALWVRDWNQASPPAQLIHQQRFDVALSLVRAGYEDLIALRDELSPHTHLFFHSYDFAIPDGRGICHLGPWLKPTFDLRNFPVRRPAQEVVEAMLRQFAAMLTSLAAHPKVTFINGQGTLAPLPTSWHNELHPVSGGFEKFADLFYRELKNKFPANVA